MEVGRALVATACAAAALLVGCGDSKPEPGPETETAAVKVGQPGGPGEPSRELAPNATPVSIKHTKADVEFMQGMIHHHQQAVVMSDYVPDRTQSTSIRL